ncbi:efflux RND transporter periplasmic adaptor subunit [Gottfriedia luciferensis]|uniref:efflux RND transporter periplasmic adaptor subunit n=1 Tax=Gottfriedia luciferensis TaxID=178774 RepID=UPI000B4479E6|nr:efflux RND transporter periplasmic adaptor subunit [Gottfriedia luciferensis]
MGSAKTIDAENEQALSPRQKKLILIGILVLIFISVGLSVAVIEVKKSKSKTLQFINPTMENFIKTKTVSGRVVQSHTETIYVNATKGAINEIFVKDGDTVSKGQNLFSYEDSTLKAEIGQAEANKKLAETSVTQKNEQITSLEQEMNEVDSSTPSSKDDANRAANISSVQSLQIELNKANDDLRVAELNVEKYTLEVEGLKAQQESLTIKSNTDGIVHNLNLNIGQGFQTSDNQQVAIMQIASNEPFQIEGKLTEEEKAKIKSGQPISVTSNVVPNKKWKGEILEVSDYPTYKSSPSNTNVKGKDSQKESIPYYSFKASLDSQKNLYPGYDTTLNVVVQSKQLLAVPETSIKGSGKSTYVYVLKKGKIEKQKVKTGPKSGKWVAILKGLKEKDKVGKNPSWTVRPGTKIDLK